VFNPYKGLQHLIEQWIGVAESVRSVLYSVDCFEMAID